MLLPQPRRIQNQMRFTRATHPQPSFLARVFGSRFAQNGGLGLLLVAFGPAMPAFAQAGDAATKARSQALAHAPSTLEEIKADDLREHAKVLASDEYAGRLTGTEGQEKAAKYFAKAFESYGLRPWGEKAGGKVTWYQGYPVMLRGFDEKKTGFFDLGTNKRVAKFGAYYLPRKVKKLDLKAKLVFGGGGDASELDLKGKICVLPFDTKQRSRRSDIYSAMSEGFRLSAKINSLANKARRGGAKAVILVDDEFSVAYLASANMMSAYPGKPKVSLAGKAGGGMRFGGTPPKLPTLVVDKEDAKAVLAALGLDFERAFGDAAANAFGIQSKKRYRLRSQPKVERKDALNVIGLLEGSDPRLKTEAIVFSCHMDHLGKTANGGFFYGADDNASGSSSVLEIAAAFGALKKSERPKRSVIFLAVSGEELGLWGSEHFANKPTWPRSKIVANINMDMLGRSTAKVPSGSVAVTPTYRIGNYSSLAKRAWELGGEFGLDMANGDKFFRRSDHWNFAKHGIPVVFFCDDEHPDYHMPTDTWQKLEYEKIERIAKLAFMIGYEAANTKRRPKELGRRTSWDGDRVDGR